MMIRIKHVFSKLMADVRGANEVTTTLIMAAVIGGGVWLASETFGDHVEEKADQTGEAIPTLGGE